MKIRLEKRLGYLLLQQKGKCEFACGFLPLIYLYLVFFLGGAQFPVKSPVFCSLSSEILLARVGTFLNETLSKGF